MTEQDRLGDSLRRARSRALIGRQAELEFIDAFLGDSTQEHLLYLYGPAGIGKSMLARECATRAAQLGMPRAFLSGDHLAVEPGVVVTEIKRAFGLGDDFELNRWEPTQTCLLVIDAFEHLEPLRDWVLHELLAALPASLRVVMAGRMGPDRRWIGDPGWQRIVRTVELQSFSEQESREYLTARNVEPERHAEAQEVTHGHPLALCLIADLLEQAPDAELPLERSPDVVQTLFAQFASDVPTYRHRLALWVCAMVGSCNQRLLAQVLQLEDASDLFDWLQGLSFARKVPGGVALHELVRDVLRMDLWWRDEELYCTISQRVIEAELHLLERLEGPARRNKIADLLFIITHATVRPERVYEARGLGEYQVVPADQEHWPRIREMVAKHEGEAALAPLEHWRTRGAETLVYGEPGEPVQGFSMMLDLHRVDGADAAADPGVQPIFEALQQRQALEPSSPSLLFRFWMTDASYQMVSELQSRIFLRIIEMVLSTEHLAFMLAVHRDPQMWIPMTAVSQIEHFPAGDFSLGTHEFGIFGNDFRQRPVETWCKRSIMMSLGVTAEATVRPPRLGYDEFVIAVKNALRQLQRPDRLQENPLLSARLVINRCPADANVPARSRALAAVLSEQSELLFATDRDQIFHQILDKTYFHPVAKQVVAASDLNLSFSTYRRYLNQALGRLSESLWQLEQA